MSNVERCEIERLLADFQAWTIRWDGKRWSAVREGFGVVYAQTTLGLRAALSSQQDSGDDRG